jgi:hypothetical protein
MSAWIVSKRHITLLVEACYAYNVVSRSTPPALLGTLLWRENVASVNHRYDDTEPVPYYTHDAASVQDLVTNPWVVYKQVRCYVYQSCEHEERWHASLAKHTVDHLAHAVLHALGDPSEEDIDQSKEYNAAPWGIGDEA